MDSQGSLFLIGIKVDHDDKHCYFKCSKPSDIDGIKSLTRL